MTSTTYVQILDGEWVEVWSGDDLYEACCDCGLVHKVDYRVRRGKMEKQVYRDRGETRKNRRQIRRTFKSTKSR